MEPREIAAEATPAVVTITALADGQQIGIGSGFVAREDGIIVTNLHVLRNADSLRIGLESGEIYDNVYVLGKDARQDLAVLQIPATGLPALSIGDDRNSEVGDPVYVMGNPQGLERTFSDGLLSATRLENGVRYLQITAPISEGSSGGPVLNSAGEAIGVATSVFTEGQNLNVAVPARYADGLLAVAGDPTPFDELDVGQAASSTNSRSPTLAERAQESSALRESLPVDARSSLDGMQPWEQQVTLRLISVMATLEEGGWESLNQGKEAYLGAGEVDTQTINLGRGAYIATAVCDDDCTDIDLVVADSEMNELGSDFKLDALPVVQFTAPRRGDYTIGVSMESCATDVCLYAIQLGRSE